MKQWIERGEVTGGGIAGCSPLQAKLLWNRGIKSAAEREKFLNCTLESESHDPSLMKDMERAVERVGRAVRENEKIVIFGDYDADGIPGAAILYEFVQKINYPHTSVYIPDRYNEKYGLSEYALRKFAEQGAKVLISVDCGITDVNETRLGQELGIDVIITDHHLPHKELPPAYAVINNKRADDEYPFKHLCGAGMAWKLAQALSLSGEFNGSDNFEHEVLDLAALSTICDMMPLVGENRALVHAGLQSMRENPRPGVNAILRQAQVRPETLCEDDIAFLVGPRINISSRMSHGVDAFNLLTARDPQVAKTLAGALEARNAERRATVQIIIDMIEEEYKKVSLPEVIAAGHQSWRVGVLGLTANRLVEKYERPVCLWTEHAGGVIKGSVRTDGTITVMDWFEAAGGAEFFADYGGHAFSGGFSLAREKEGELRERLHEAHKRLEKLESEQEKLFVDEKLTLADINWQMWKELEPLAPFGEGNQKPTFLFENLILESCVPMGKDANHMRLSVRDPVARERRGYDVLGFFVTAKDFPALTFCQGERVDLLANIEKTHFRGRPELRLRLVDLRPAK